MSHGHGAVLSNLLNNVEPPFHKNVGVTPTMRTSIYRLRARRNSRAGGRGPAWRESQGRRRTESAETRGGVVHGV